MKWIKHLKTIQHHKKLVMQHCFKVGLYYQGVMHDLSKYSPTEFLAGVKFYQGNRSPNDAERENRGYSSAWLHHKGRNKHHLEYWVDYSPEMNGQLAGIKIPEKYVVEMFCDRLAASKTYRRKLYNDCDPYEYYQHSKQAYLMHPESQALLEELLVMLKEQGEDVVFFYIRSTILRRKWWKTKKKH